MLQFETLKSISEMVALGKIVRLLLTTTCIVTAVSGDKGQSSNTLFVKPNITTTCVHTPCQTLMWYVTNGTEYFTSNTTMNFLPGKYILNKIVRFKVTNVTNFKMLGSNSSITAKLSLESRIVCKENGGGFSFISSTKITIAQLSFEGCGVGISPFGSIPSTNDEIRVFAAVAFFKCCNIHLSRVIVRRSLGYGFFVKNGYGILAIEDSVFTGSRQHKKNYHTGNAFINYSDCLNHNTTILINNSYFLNGTSNIKHLVYINDLKQYGIGLFLYLLCHNIFVSIENITARGNYLAQGNGGNIAISLAHNTNSQVVINNSHIEEGRAESGGGLSVVYYNDYSYPVQMLGYGQAQSHIMIENTEFRGNIGIKEGGAMYIMYYEQLGTRSIVKTVHLFRCEFTDNYSKDSGGAVVIVNHKVLMSSPHLVSQLVIKFEECYFTRCRAEQDAIVHLFSADYVEVENSTFIKNIGTAVSLTSSSLSLKGYNLFQDNRGVYGGALNICDQSHLLLTRDSHTKFFGNKANQSGGAIYAQQQCLDSLPPCFFQPTVNISSVDQLGKHILLEFDNNSAGVAGNAIYGGSVDECFTYNQYSVRNESTHLASEEIFDAIFMFSSSNQISSNPSGVCLCDSHMSTLHCETQFYHLNTFAGKKFTISASAVGQRNGSVPAKIIILNGNLTSSMERTYIVPYNDQAIVTDMCQNIQLAVFPNNSHVILTLFVQQPQTKINQRHPTQDIILNISIEPCPWIFELTRVSKGYKCKCNHVLTMLEVKCDINNGSVQRNYSHTWIGCYDSDFNQSACSNTPCKLVVGTNDCKEDYCSSSTDNLIFTSVDQCVEGREGVACGACVEGYSLALGPLSKCVNDCHIWNLFLLLLGFVLAGILLIAFLAIFNLTVSEGTLNGLLFYANLVHANHESLFTIDSVTSNNIDRIFIAWLNLDLGVRVCFYEGMDVFQKQWLELGFILYLLFLEVMIILLSHKFIFFTRVIGRNSINVLATVLLLMYIKTIRIIMKSLQYIRLHLSNNTIELVWYMDGNIKYFHGKHIPLGIIAILLSGIVFLYAISLVFIQCLQRNTNWSVLRWIEKIRPFYDCYTGVCRDNYRFWPGLLIFLRLVMYSLSTVLAPKPKLLFTLVLCILVFILTCVSPSGVYKKRALNILEFSFILNLGLLSGVNSIYRVPHNIAFTYSSVGVAMVTSVGILLYHGYRQIKASRRVRQIFEYFLKRKQQSVTSTEPNSDSTSTTPLLSNCKNLPPVVHFDQLREPCLADDCVTQYTEHSLHPRKHRNSFCTTS